MNSCLPGKGANDGRRFPPTAAWTRGRGLAAAARTQNLLVFKNDCERIVVDVLDVTLEEKQRERETASHKTAKTRATRSETNL